MKRLKTFLKKLFFLPPLLTVLIAVPSYIFVFIMLGIGDHSVLSYLAYFLSAYAVIITITGMSGVIKAIQGGIEEISLVKKFAAPLWETVCWETPSFARKSRFTADCS